MIIRLLFTVGLIYWINTGSQVAITIAFSLLFISTEAANYLLKRAFKHDK